MLRLIDGLFKTPVLKSFIVLSLTIILYSFYHLLAESSLGMIFSETKCVGKSMSLFLLALGQGIPNRVHLMFLSGGNQLVCGTSA